MLLYSDSLSAGKSGGGGTQTCQTASTPSAVVQHSAISAVSSVHGSPPKQSFARGGGRVLRRQAFPGPPLRTPVVLGQIAVPSSEHRKSKGRHTALTQGSCEGIELPLVSFESCLRARLCVGVGGGEAPAKV